MSYTILFSERAKKDVGQLDAVIQKRLAKKFKQISQLDDIKPLVKHLTNFDAGTYRLRIGDYRVVFDIDNSDIYILRIRHRKECYLQ